MISWYFPAAQQLAYHKGHFSKVDEPKHSLNSSQATLSNVGADGYNVPDIVCDIYFGGQKPCLGGILALDGLTGATLWKRWAKHEVFALTCQEDLNNDNVVDCVAGGRAGVSDIYGT